MSLRPILKLATFVVGLGWLVYGALFYDLQDWDIGVSLMMAFSTYFTAEWVVGVIYRLEYCQWLNAAFLTWFSVQGSYAGYWLLLGQPERMVEGQWITSLCLYALCGVIWYRLVPIVAETLEAIMANRRTRNYENF